MFATQISNILAGPKLEMLCSKRQVTEGQGILQTDATRAFPQRRDETKCPLRSQCGSEARLEVRET